MTANERDKPTAELETRYRDHGDVEPDPGLDRIIRARAEEATRRRPVRGAPWLGGLATASMAVVVVAVVLQQPEGPETARQEIPQATERSAGIEADLAPESAPEPALPARASEKSETADLAGDASADAPAARVVSERARFSDEQAVDAGAGAELREAQAPAPNAFDEEVSAEALIRGIREALAGEDLQKASELVADYRRRFPERPLPEELARRLDDG